MATNDDAQTDLKKRARRRLVGAAALALLAVIVLPMVMDPAPRPVGEDIQVRIPSQDGENFAQRRIEQPTRAAEAPSEDKAAPSATPAPQLEPVTQAPPVSTPEAPKPLEAMRPAEPPRPAAETQRESERVAAILAGKAAAAAAAAPAKPEPGGFVVQLGAYSKEESAAAQAGTVRQKGYKAFTEKIGSTTRVRVGPYPSREAAEKAAEQLARAGFKGVVLSRD